MTEERPPRLKTGPGCRPVAVYLNPIEQRQLKTIMDGMKKPSQAAAIRWAIGHLASEIPYREMNSVGKKS